MYGSSKSGACHHGNKNDAQMSMSAFSIFIQNYILPQVLDIIQLPSSVLASTAAGQAWHCSMVPWGAELASCSITIDVELQWFVAQTSHVDFRHLCCYVTSLIDHRLDLVLRSMYDL